MGHFLDGRLLHVIVMPNSVKAIKEHTHSYFLIHSYFLLWIDDNYSRQWTGGYWGTRITRLHIARTHRLHGIDDYYT